MQRIIRATKNSLEGLKALWRFEQAFRQEVYLGCILVLLLFVFKITAILKLVLVLLFLLLLVTEAINSAIEAIVDRISLEFHPKSKLAKDTGSAAVFLVFIMNIIAWIYAIFTIVCC